MSRRSRASPHSRACRSSARSTRRATPRPRASGAVHTRLTSPVFRIELFQRPYPNRLSIQAGDGERALRRGEFIWQGRRIGTQVETSLESRGKLAEIAPEANERIGPIGLLERNLDFRRPEKPLHLGHRGDKPLAFASVKALENQLRKLVGARS